MSENTAGSDGQKSCALNRLSSLSRAAEELIVNGSRCSEDIELLLEALQAFGNGDLGAVVRTSRTSSSTSLSAICERDVRTAPFTKEDLQYVVAHGVRYIGELFYLFFDPRSPRSVERGQRMLQVLTEHYGLAPQTDPLAAGWVPSYWSDPAFLVELNTLLLERCPTPSHRPWGRYRFVQRSNALRTGNDAPERRGLARFSHTQGIHFAGELLVRMRGAGQFCPAMKCSAQYLDQTRCILREMDSQLWAAALVPSTWMVPDWQGEVWQGELVAIARENEEIRAIEGRMRAEQVENKRRKDEESDRRREQVLASPDRILDRSVECLELSVRSAQCLRNANIETIRQLVHRTEAEMLQCKNFGQISLKEVNEVLRGLGLRLGMTDADF